MYCITDSSNNAISVLHRTLGINSFYIQALVSDLLGGGVGWDGMRNRGMGWDEELGDGMGWDEELGDGGMERLLRALEWQTA